MADKDQAAKATPKAAEPAPVDVKASVPLEVKVTAESVAALGGDVGALPAAVPAVAPQVTTTTTTTIPVPITVTKGDGITLQPTTTEAQDKLAESLQEAKAKTTEGQRLINEIWETTQSRIALLVVVAGVFINSAVITSIIFLNKEVSVTQLALISICLQFINLTTGIVIGFYFSRTNHQAIGGTGEKPIEPYIGR